MSVGQRTWTTTAAERRLGRFLLVVGSTFGGCWWWRVRDTGVILVSGEAPDEKAAKLAARRWVEAASRRRAR